jgi:hypothetical protein
MECSAKKGANVNEVFRSFLSLAKIPVREPSEEEDCGLKRRLSAHAGSKSKNRSPSTSTTPTQPSSPIFGRFGSGFSTPTSRGPASPSALSRQSPQFLSAEDPSIQCPFSRHKPRSRSLIRRCSKKVKKQVQDVSEGPDGCLLS